MLERKPGRAYYGVPAPSVRKKALKGLLQKNPGSVYHCRLAPFADPFERRTLKINIALLIIIVNTLRNFFCLDLDRVLAGDSFVALDSVYN